MQSIADNNWPKPLEDQIKILATDPQEYKNFKIPDLGELPRGANGQFAIPNIWKPDLSQQSPYFNAVLSVIDALTEHRNGDFDTTLNYQIFESMRQNPDAEKAMRKLSENQGNPDILVIAAQFDSLYRNVPIDEARMLMAQQNQYELGAFVTGIMLLTHPERLQQYDDLQISCTGDVCSDPSEVDCQFDLVPAFYMELGRLNLGMHQIDHSSLSSGSASGFFT